MDKPSLKSLQVSKTSINHEGLVYEVLGTHYMVRTSAGEFFKCKTIKSTQTENPDSTLVVVGDWVQFKSIQPNSDIDIPEGIILKVLARKMRLARKRNRKTNRSGEVEHVLASNIDQLVIVASGTMPPLRKGLIDRYLAFAEAEGLKVLIVINKLDLSSAEELDQQMKVYSDLGYDVLLVSAKTKSHIEKLRDCLVGKISVLSGHSGVGKSSLINTLVGSMDLKTGDLSQKSMKGVHVTSGATMLVIPGNNQTDSGLVIDTPGIREFALIDIDKQNLRHYFIEFSGFAEDCKYSSCLHLNEPGCAVIRAVENGDIDQERYKNYVSIFDTLDNN